MGRKSRSRLAADWFAKLRINAQTQEVEHSDVSDVKEEVDTSVSSDLAALDSDKADATYVASEMAKLDSEKADLSYVTNAIANATMADSDILSAVKRLDGSGSGLDADTVDGQEGSYYRNASNINAGTISDARLPATISSNITGSSASCTGNAATSTNTSKLNNKTNSTSSTGSTIVERDSSGDINARLFRSEYDSTNSSIGLIMTQVDTASNNYIRPSTPAQVAAALSSHIEGVPSGVITMWSGSVSSIPAGWYLCNGSNGTPDLRNRFVYGASSDGEVKTTGGSANAVVVSHSHTASTNTTGNHRHSITTAGTSDGGTNRIGHDSKGNTRTDYTNYAGNHSHTVTVNSSGGSGTNKNLPPYMKLAYIMKG